MISCTSANDAALSGEGERLLGWPKLLLPPSSSPPLWRRLSSMGAFGRIGNKCEVRARRIPVVRFEGSLAATALLNEAEGPCCAEEVLLFLRDFLAIGGVSAGVLDEGVCAICACVLESDTGGGGRGAATGGKSCGKLMLNRA